MKTTNSIRLLGILFLVFVVDILCWKQTTGLNVLVLFVLILPVSYFFYPAAYQYSSVRRMTGLTFVAAMLLVLDHSAMAKWMFTISMFLWVGWLHHPRMRSSVHTFIGGLHAYSKGLFAFSAAVQQQLVSQEQIKKYWSFARISLIPIILVGLYGFLIHLGNPAFARLGEVSFTAFFRILEKIEIGRGVFWLFSLSVCAGILFRQPLRKLLKKDLAAKEELLRERKQSTIQWSFNGLRKEYRMAGMILLSVNALLMLSNSMDIAFLWRHEGAFSPSELSQMVHSGTYALILSILLSIGTVLYFFRRNLNFHPKARLLQTLAYLWMGQNLILIISVAIRNMNYVSSYGLSNKRIGVMIFLGLTLIGISSILWKISRQKSSFALLNFNARAFYLVLLCLSMVNWDSLIAHHNLRHADTNKLDASYLLALSDRALPALAEHYRQFENENNLTSSMKNRLEWKLKNYVEEVENQSIWSWTLNDHQNIARLSKIK